MKRSERHKKVSELFLAACDRPVDQRSAFVAEACGDDQALRAEVESLLSHDTEESVVETWNEHVGQAAANVVRDRPVSGAGPAAVPSIDGYEIEGVLGQGGMGIVYRAKQTKLQRVVALKVLPAIVGSANPAAVERFRREATAAASLHHTNIVPIYDFGESRDAYYYAMELIDGLPLDEVIQRLSTIAAPSASIIDLASMLQEMISTASVADSQSEANERGPERSASPGRGSSSTGRDRAYFRHIARWIADAAEALQYAHNHSIIHRDIKPSNLIVTVEDRIMIADFGLAKSTDEHSITMTGALMGSLRYMSPEQAMAKRVHVDHRTDVYSLGATLYELLTLRPAFPGGDDKRVLGAIISREPTAPRKINSSVPKELETICLKTLEKSPDARYDTARALGEDLRSYINDQPITARRPSLATRALRYARRHGEALTAAAFALFVVAGAALVVARVRADTNFRNCLAEHVRRIDKRNWIEAGKTLNKCNDIKPAHPRITLRRAWALKKQYDETDDFSLLERANELCEEFLADDPHDAEKAVALNIQGVFFKENGNYEKAEESYRKVTDLTPDRYPAWVNLGTVHCLMRELGLAESDFSAAITAAEIYAKNEKDACEAWRNMAALQLHLGERDCATELLKQAKHRNKEDAATYLLRMRMDLDFDPEIASHRVSQVEESTSGKSPQIQRVIAMIKLREKKFERAEQRAKA
ncbi:MAG: serine/threonine-protein kinase, partial [Phycisphaerae bacterium]